MGDGDVEDAATPGRPHPGSDDPPANTSNRDWLTRSRQPMRGAAPWERELGGPEPDESGPVAEPSAPVTVADLIAKINGGALPPEPKRHRARP